MIPIQILGQEWVFGPLVCYEDMFPLRVRESVRAGADVLYVATNDAWYGTEGAAYFHAAHSVLRAVENRRPILRCGNAGWSGWIDAYGSIRGELSDEANSIYFKGSGNFVFSPQLEWRWQQSFTRVTAIGLSLCLPCLLLLAPDSPKLSVLNSRLISQPLILYVFP